MVSAPHHPFVHDFLIPGQIDGHNSTLNYFSQKFVQYLANWFWEEWNPNYFRDRNHLGEAGRTYYCERIAEEIDKSGVILYEFCDLFVLSLFSASGNTAYFRIDLKTSKETNSRACFNELSLLLASIRLAFAVIAPIYLY